MLSKYCTKAVSLKQFTTFRLTKRNHYKRCKYSDNTEKLLSYFFTYHTFIKLDQRHTRMPSWSSAAPPPPPSAYTPQPFLRIGNNGIGLLLHLCWCAVRLNFEDGTCHRRDAHIRHCVLLSTAKQLRAFGCVVWPCQQQHSSRVAL